MESTEGRERVAAATPPPPPPPPRWWERFITTPVSWVFLGVITQRCRRCFARLSFDCLCTIARVLKSYVASTPIAMDEDTGDTYGSIGSTEQHGSTNNITFAEIMKIRPASWAYRQEFYIARRVGILSRPDGNYFFSSSLLCVLPISFIMMMSTSSHHP